MQVKEGVVLIGVQWQMFWASIIVEKVYDHYEVPCVITSGVDGVHHGNGTDDTLHYKGLALDYRTREFRAVDLPKVRAEIAAALGPNYDVVLEKDHLHVEFDPD